MNIIPEWYNKNLKCHFCNGDIDVKYETEVFDPVVSSRAEKVCMCSRCSKIYRNSDRE